MGIEVDSFLGYLMNIKRYSPLTGVAYKKDLNQFVEFCEKVELVHEWSEVKMGMVRRFEVALMSGKLFPEEKGRKQTRKPMSAKSVRRKLSALRALFRFLLREGKVEEDPTETIIVPKIAKRLPVFVPDYKLDELLDKRMSEKGDFKDFRDLMFLMVAYYTGMRRAELIGMKVEDIDFESQLIKVTGKGNKQRLVPLLDELAEEMRQYLKQRACLVGGAHSFFFVTNAGKPVNEKFIYRHVKAMLGEVTSLRKCSPHVLRHSFATALLNNGACVEAIRKLLGHSSLAATEIYAHNSFESLKKVYNEAHPRA